jgi:hypothetical protein
VTDAQLSPNQLRELYVRGTLRQRYGIACQRIDHPELGPSVLVNAVSALEGFSRAVAVRALIETGTKLEEAYEYHRRASVVHLIARHICPILRTTPVKAFGAKAWGRIPLALEYRNLLIHEATFLNGGTCRQLIAATRHCLDRLATLTGAT